MMRKIITAAYIVCSLSFIACGEADPATAGTDETEIADTAGGDDEACNTLCVDAGFDSGDEEDFGGGLVECLCSGTGDGITQAACTAYCADFEVDEANSLLSTEATDNDKCVCDGTAL